MAAAGKRTDEHILADMPRGPEQEARGNCVVRRHRTRFHEANAPRSQAAQEIRQALATSSRL